MKLLHVIGTFYVGGAEVFIKNLILLQRAEGLDVELLLLSKSENFLIKELKDNGVKVHFLHKEGRGYRNPLNIFFLMPWLRRYDILHVHLVPEVFWVALAKIFSFSNVRTITTVHFPKSIIGGNNIIKKIFERFSFRFGYDYVVACSNDSLLSLNEYSPMSNNISIPNGVDVDRFHKAKPYSKSERFGIPENDFVVTMVAAIKPQKIHSLLIESLALLPDNVHAVFCGSGDGLDSLQSLAKEKNVDSRTHFLGNCADVDRIVNTSDVNALLTHYEGLSLSSLEAMASGKPFIGSRVNGMESILDGAGVLVENTPEDVAAAIRKLMEDKEYYDMIGSQCYERAKKYDIHKMANEYLSVYNKMVSKKRS